MTLTTKYNNIVSDLCTFNTKYTIITLRKLVYKYYHTHV